MNDPLEIRFGNSMVNIKRAIARDFFYLGGLLGLYDLAKKEMDTTVMNQQDETPECYQFANELEREMEVVGLRMLSLRAYVHNKLSQGGTA
jgi:hypothetical protein